MFKRILVPVDFSEPSAAALRLAIQLARNSAGQITLLHVGLSPGIGTFEPGQYAVPSLDALNVIYKEAAEEQQRALNRFAEEEVPQDVAYKTLTREGAVKEEVLAQARDGGHDLIVMGTHGREGMRRVLLGSITEGVIRAAEIPVLVTH